MAAAKVTAVLTREQMARIRTGRHDATRAALNGDAEFCPVANAEVMVPKSGICVWCSTDHSLAGRLTNRMVEGMRLLAAGSTRKQIAFHLSVSEATVANDWRDIRKLLGSRTTTQAVVMLVREGSI